MAEDYVMDERAKDADAVARRLAPLLKHGEAALKDLAVPADELRRLGFLVRGGRVQVPADVERLDPSAIEAGLSAAARGWVRRVERLEVVGSTSALLNERAARGSVEGMVLLAELQLQGRGRRGRAWMSPYASNLAVSMGVRLPQPPDELGGFSLCMGLAVADCLEAGGVTRVALKWPNDVLVGGRKIAGVLVELHRGRDWTEVVVGVGVNFRLPREARTLIDQPVTDLAEAAEGAEGCGGTYSRNRVAADLISSLVDFTRGFSRHGFAPMVKAFDARHRFHDETCTLLLGGGNVTGRVRGVDEGGRLLLETEGRVRRFSSGEVSLRPV